MTLRPRRAISFRSNSTVNTGKPVTQKHVTRFTGPDTILEGEFGFLNVFCRNADPQILVEGLGETFDTLNICLKRFPCHIVAHTPVQAVLDLMAAIHALPVAYWGVYN